MGKFDCWQRLSWLPGGAVVVLAIALVAKGVAASWLDTMPQVHARKMPRFVQPEALLVEADHPLVPAVKAGIWSVEGSNWDFQSETVSTLQLAPALSQVEFEGGIESTSAEHLALLDLIPAARANVKQIGTAITRSIDFGTVQAAVMYRESPNQKSFVCAKIANQIDADQWQLITLSPKAASLQSSDHLLPIEGLGTSVCQRFSESGALQCEIVNTARPLEGIVDFWGAHGWNVQPFSAADSEETHIWRCIKGERSIHVRANKDAVLSTSTLVLSALDTL